MMKAVKGMKLVILAQVDSIRGKNVVLDPEIVVHNNYFLSSIEEGYSFINGNTEDN